MKRSSFGAWNTFFLFLFLKKLFQSRVLCIIFFLSSLFMSGRWLFLMYFFLLRAWLFASIQTVINLLWSIASMFNFDHSWNREIRNIHCYRSYYNPSTVLLLAVSSRRKFSLQLQSFYINQIDLSPPQEFTRILKTIEKIR